MQYQSIVNILDTGKVHNLINLIYIEKMMHTTLSSLSIKLNIKFTSETYNLIDERGNLLDRFIKGMK